MAIEKVYNQKRLYSALGYRSHPNDLERLVLIQDNIGAPCLTLPILPVQSKAILIRYGKWNKISFCDPGYTLWTSVAS
jgi:hypothetical protein